MSDFLSGLRQGWAEGPRIFFAPVIAFARVVARLARLRDGR
jgi:hypothetical protein